MTKKTAIIQSWLNRPFPFSESSSTKIRTIVLFSLFIFFFLAFFQPFGIESIAQNKYLFLAGFGVITFIGMMITYFVLPIFFPGFFDLDNWRIKNHIVFALGNILLIALLNWQYSNGAGQGLTKEYGLFYFLVMTAGVGFIPLIILTMVIERSLWNKHRYIAQDISDQLELQKGTFDNEEPISLVAENTTECFNLPQNQLICIVSEGNYSKVYYCHQEKTEEKLLRMPLKKVEELLAKFEKIVRCHRSYIVNLPQITSVSGNARSYKLHVAELDFAIPVSRSFPKTMIEHLKS